MGTEEPRGQDPIWPAFVTVIAFAVLPYVELVGGNRGQGLDYGLLALMAVGTVVGASVPLLALARQGPSAVLRTAVFVGYFTWCLFHFDLFAVQGWGDPLPVWLALVALGSVPLVLLSRRRGVQIGVAVVGVALLLAALGSLAISPGAVSDASGPGSPAAGVMVEEISDPRSVYHFMLDAYGAPDVIQQNYDVDVTDFTSWLDDHGFSVSDDMVANYPWTWLSLPSMLEMRYLVDVGERVGTDLQPYRDIMGGSNTTARTFKSAGYQYVHASPGVYAGSVCSGAEDVCVGNRGGLSETSWAILNRTPISARAHLIAGAIDHVAAYTDPAVVAREVLASSDGRPVFAFMHILAPHPPYLRHADCSLRADATMDLEAFDAPRQRYADAVECLNRRLKEAVTTILATDPTAIIILQGDHGPSGYGFDWTNVADYGERLPIFSAWRTPEGCPQHAATPVNTYRIVFDCISPEAIDLLADKSLLGGYNDRDAEIVKIPRP